MIEYLEKTSTTLSLEEGRCFDYTIYYSSQGKTYKFSDSFYLSMNEKTILVYETSKYI